MALQVFGVPVSRGVAIGRAVLVSSSRVDVAHYFIAPDQVGAELKRLRQARDRVVDELAALKDDLPEDAPPELAALLDVHLMLLYDDSLGEATARWVIDRHYNAEWALAAQLEVVARQFDEMEDPYLRERKADLEQVVERLIKACSASSAGLGLSAPQPRDFGGEDPLVLVAADIAPADMLQFKRSVFTGFVTEVGGRTSHTAIVARSLDIPAVVGAREASRLIRQDDWVVIDGDAGLVVVDPPAIVLEEYRFRQRQSALERARLDRLRHTPAVTVDGLPIELLANIEMPEDAAAAVAAGALGVGLFRSEFLFMNRGGDLPSEDEQYLAYRKVLEDMRGLPVTIRTVDVGADKPLDRPHAAHGGHDTQLNPALGERAIRWSLAEPDMFADQLRALLRAAAHGKVRILLPMVAHVSEAVAARAALDSARRSLDARAVAYGPVELGAMIEVPAAALAIDRLIPHFDFFSIGTNDLIQYTLAIDRADERVAHLYEPWHPAVLQLIKRTISLAEAAGRPVSVCGELAGDPAFTEALLCLGLRSFSMHPAQIATIKQRVLRADAGRLQSLQRHLLDAADPASAAGVLLQRSPAAPPAH